MKAKNETTKSEITRRSRTNKNYKLEKKEEEKSLGRMCHKSKSFIFLTQRNL